MNNQRRKKIKIITKNLEQIVEQIGEVLEEEQVSRDNLPEGLIDSDKYSVLEDNCEIIEEGYNTIQEIIDNFLEL